MAKILKRYVCAQWPHLNLGSVKFDDGLFDATTAEEVDVVEKSGYLGRQILAVSATELASEQELLEAGSEAMEEKHGVGGVVQGSRGTGPTARKKK